MTIHCTEMCEKGGSCNNKGGSKGFCPFSLVLFFGSLLIVTSQLQEKKKEREAKAKAEQTTKDLPSCKVIFVLGGPGTGKGTQCQLLCERLENWVHISAGDVLREARNKAKQGLSGSDAELGQIIENHISQGQIVPSEITVKLIEQAMIKAYDGNKDVKFLIDGFPRSQGNVDAWESQMKQHNIEFVLNFIAPEEILVGRLLERGRGDDSLEVIKKRFKTQEEQAAPILKIYEQQNKLKTIKSDRSVEDVYKEVSELVKNV